MPIDNYYLVDQGNGVLFLYYVNFLNKGMFTEATPKMVAQVKKIELSDCINEHVYLIDNFHFKEQKNILAYARERRLGK